MMLILFLLIIFTADHKIKIYNNTKKNTQTLSISLYVEFSCHISFISRLEKISGITQV